MLNFNKYFFILLSLMALSFAVEAKDNYTFTLKELGLDTEEQEKKKKKNEFLECMMSKIKPESTESHKSVIEEYCVNKVYKK